MKRDADAVLAAERGASELERLSALETLKGLKDPDKVFLGELVAYLEERGLWSQFAKITLGDLRDTFGPLREQKEEEARAKKKKRRILEEELGGEAPVKKKAEPTDGGLETEEVARMVLPFIEGNGEVTLEDCVEYTQLDKKVLRHHLGAMVKEGRLERLGVGRHAIYSTVG